MREKKVLLANKGLLSHESIVLQCSPKKEQSPWTFVVGVLPARIW